MSNPSTKARGWPWPVMIVGLLAMQVVLCAAGIYAATRSSSAAVESNYYDKALRWDEQAARQRASDALHWQAEVEVLDGTGPDAAAGLRSLAITLRDAAGAPVTGAKMNVRYFHHAQGRDVQQATLNETRPGRYAALVPLGRAGVWEFRAEGARGNDVFLKSWQSTLGALTAGDLRP